MTFFITTIAVLLMFSTPAHAGKMMTCAKLEKMSMKMMQKACKSHMGLSCCRQEDAHLSGYMGTTGGVVSAPPARGGQRLRTVRERPRLLSKRK